MQPRRRSGFTLIELMVVVGILGILASAAIANYMRFQMRARAAEAKSNLAAIRTGEHGYYSEFGTFVGAPAHPRATAAVDTARVPWTAPAAGFDTIGWSPDGEVYFAYQVQVGPGGGFGGCGGVACSHFTAEAVSDIDGNGVQNWWGYVEPNAAGASVPGTVCPATGTFNGNTGANDLLATVGPCAGNMGSAIF